MTEDDGLDAFDVRTSRNDEVKVQLRDDSEHLDYAAAVRLAELLHTKAEESRNEDI